MTKQKTSSQSRAQSSLSPFMVRRLSEGGFIIALTLALFVLLSLLTYQVGDPGLFHVTKRVLSVANSGGQVGAYIADLLYGCFGYFAYLVPVSMVFVAWVIVKENRAAHAVNEMMLSLRGVGFLFLLIGGCGLLALEVPATLAIHIERPGGYLGHMTALFLSHGFNVEGATLLLLSVFLVGMTWLTGLSWIHVTGVIGYYGIVLFQWLMTCCVAGYRWLQSYLAESKAKPQPLPTQRKPMVIEVAPSVAKPAARSKPDLSVSRPLAMAEPLAITPSTPKDMPLPKVAVTGSLPSLSLLDKGKPSDPMAGHTHQELEVLSREVEQHLQDFGIQAEVVAVHPGPVITRFELQLAAGVKVSKLTALAKDLARSLSVTSVRVVEIIPGKTVVGIELPNLNRAMVCLSDVLGADVYQQAHSHLSLALGVDIAGHPMVVDLAKMPHLLVAGTTGSGKSVGINAMILSLLYKATPDEVRLIMVDPKMLELSVYDGIPHLLTPVVTDMKEAASALRWCVAEMERRYRLMATVGVRNLAGFNTKLQEAVARGEPMADPLWKPVSSMDEVAPLLQPLPYIVVIIDELADMMMVVGKKVEQLIARIAQKARAAGIHLILATQRPSVDVLTGLIKSNIPTRISFQVSSKIDSRTILDQQGAEQLLGHGDMLFLAPGTGAPLRVHGAFVDDQEVHRVADDWRARGEPEYIEEITQTSDGFDGGGSEDGQATEEADPLYDQAVEFVIQTRKASISAVQRRFKIGYNRAARLVEEMERTGLVGPLDGGFRDVLVSNLVED